MGVADAALEQFGAAPVNDAEAAENEKLAKQLEDDNKQKVRRSSTTHTHTHTQTQTTNILQFVFRRPPFIFVGPPLNFDWSD